MNLFSVGSILLGLFVATSQGVSTAQTQPSHSERAAKAVTTSSKLYKSSSGPLKQVSLDLGTGAYVRGPVVRNRGATTVSDFYNLDSFDGSGVGYLSVDTGGGSCRWFSNAAKGKAANQSSNNSDLMHSITFSYCSNALDVNSGGAGGSVTLGFYQGYTVFGGAPTTTAVVLNLTGMPANTSDGSFLLPGAGCYEMHVVFPTLVAFADHQFIGYSWQFDDLGADGILGNTYPFFSCVVSCSGLSLATQGTCGGVGGNPLMLGEDGQGMVDAIDQYCVTPLTSSTFSYGTIAAGWAPTTRTSMSMAIMEAADLAATAVNYNATLTPNADTLSATKAIVGKLWTATITRSPASVAGTFNVWVYSAQSVPNGANPPFFHTGRKLVSMTNYFPPFPSGGPSGAHNGTTGILSVLVPPSFSFLCAPWAAQARIKAGAGAFKLSSATRGTIGTF